MSHTSNSLINSQFIFYNFHIRCLEKFSNMSHSEQPKPLYLGVTAKLQNKHFRTPQTFITGVNTRAYMHY
jgi:hypothetical protein